MELKKSLLALGVSSVLMAGVCTTAAAQTAQQEDDSVYRWGRWAVLAPAAGNEEVIAFSPPGTNDLGRCESAANCPSPINGPPVTAVSPCTAGMPCGFARVDQPHDASQNTKPDSSDVVPFALTIDEEAGTVAYVVDPGTADEINSPAVAARILQHLVSLRSTDSTLTGPIQARNAADQPALVQGPWRRSVDNGAGGIDNHGGEFVWGITATTGEMQTLLGSLGGSTAVYQGMTMGTTNGNEGTVRLDIDFGAATWSGQFNADLNFTASGAVVGSGFVSDATGFSNNIASGEVKGGFVNAGNNAIGEYDVIDTTGIQAADVFNTTLQNPLVQPAL